MLLSHLIGKRSKKSPGDAVLASHSILLRGGYVRQVANGIYSLLPLGLRVVKKIEGIIREEMNAIGGQEVLMPVVLPRELWDQSGRFGSVGSQLLRFKDRTEHDMVLAMTHEEAVVHLSRNEAGSYRSYPFMLYQFQTKFRDEPRSRGGLVRVREFTMKDAYSFHTDRKSLDEYYERCAAAYSRIFDRVGIPEVRKIESDTGMMGGEAAHEYMLIAQSGEDTVVACGSCDYLANLEVAACRHRREDESPSPLEKVRTPGKRTIAEVAGFLSLPEHKTAKVVFYESDSAGEPVMAVIRGDLNVNEAKLSKVIGIPPRPAGDATIGGTGAVPGFASPMGITGCRIIADRSVLHSVNLVTGANEADFHFMNFNLERDARGFEVADIAEVREGDACPRCGGRLAFQRGIEVGNIFQLGTKYTWRMGMRYMDDRGNECTPLMGCYGIGIGRLMASIVEARHDAFGPVWPLPVAPFSVHIIALNLPDGEKASFSRPVYQELLSRGVDAIYDDREERPGVQFADADLIGAPLRLVFSGRNLEGKKIEWKRRDGTAGGVIDSSDIAGFVSDFVTPAPRSRF